MKQFHGGPYDGHPLNDGDEDYPFHTFDMPGDRMAVYEVDEDGEFRFAECRPSDNPADDDLDDCEFIGFAATKPACERCGDPNSSMGGIGAYGPAEIWRNARLCDPCSQELLRKSDEHLQWMAQRRGRS